MSDTTPTPSGTPTPASPAQEAFGRYKARLTAGPVAFPAMTSWGMPPSMGALPPHPSGYPHVSQGPVPPHPLGSLTERLGATLRLGVDLLNATLASGARALGGGMMPSQADDAWGGHGCGCDPCGYDCCGVMAAECCRPGVHGCGCGCG